MSLDDDSRDRDASHGAGSVEGSVDSFELPDLPELSLPEIPLPEIPELDLDSILAPSAKSGTDDSVYSSQEEFSIDEYGSHGSGPVSFADMQRIVKKDDIAIPGAPPSSSDQNRFMDIPSITTPDIKFKVPKSAEIQDTGMAPLDENVFGKPGSITEIVRGKLEVEPPKRKKRQAKASRKRSPSKKSPSKNRSRSSSKGQQDKFAPTGVQVPLGENVIDFSNAPGKVTDTQQEVVVNLKDGYLEKNGSSNPIEPNLKASLAKVHEFLQREFVTVDRAQILGRIRSAAKHGKDTEEMLKLLVTPILRLGKKRYAVINDLLKMKDVLPKFSKNVFLAFMVSLLSD